MVCTGELPPGKYTPSNLEEGTATRRLVEQLARAKRARQENLVGKFVRLTRQGGRLQREPIVARVAELGGSDGGEQNTGQHRVEWYDRFGEAAKHDEWYDMDRREDIEYEEMGLEEYGQLARLFAGKALLAICKSDNAPDMGIYAW